MTGPTRVDYICETLQAIVGGAPLAVGWLAANYHAAPWFLPVSGGLGLASYLSGRYLRLCTPDNAPLAMAAARAQLPGQ